ncbi:Phosphoribosylaminoimidazole-succinocarboxamide synthase [Chlamydia abortus]|uniref:Phosphoribosylaminoimidazole-succinocarboxamide synthase n=1 Tax=Paenibacillus residui TaxID=629724 RepID=A0ABW3DE07_9BACL|nr:MULTISPECIES: phosphoribosylaminoimidazolesuccinocarboxamide synthase [Paenibacillaceae]SHE12846.1 Phosphoribosylaminoimidazole-succinocarboxamide synthase [Chlamydia abortus]
MNNPNAIATAVDYIQAPLVYKGKVRELYDLGEHYLIAVTDRISAFDYVLKPAVPSKGEVLNQLSKFWFGKTESIIPNHMIHADADRLSPFIQQPDLLRNRIMVTRKAERIDIECVVRGYITGGGWRKYKETGEINGHKLPAGLRKNERLAEPIFTPAAKNDVGHDEDISIERMKELVGERLTEQLMAASLRLYQFAHDYCGSKGVILADTKFEFGLIDGRILLIDEAVTPDSSRFWARENYALDIEIDSMDKEPVRTYLAGSGWDRNSEPEELPEEVVRATSERYREIYRRLVS